MSWRPQMVQPPKPKLYIQSRGHAQLPAGVGGIHSQDPTVDRRPNSSSSASQTTKLRRAQSVPVLQPLLQPISHQGLTEAHVRELRQLQRPPEIVRRALGAAHLVLGARGGAPTPRCPTRLADIQRTLSSEDLLTLGRKELRELQARPGLAKRLSKEFLAPPGLQPLTQERIHHASPAAAALFAWSTGVSEKNSTKKGKITTEKCTEEPTKASPRNPLVVNKCSCGFACGPEHIFMMHMKSVEGDPSHQRVVSITLPAESISASGKP
eukprot:gnl/MRDRNA2_/MRDRNA2_113426_c0_seq1.p1 gnl/MRDRNA2_/MRDRNA2_113426_c0~~gnl/MRDRNA2_/MRDRNA2_113426_c0_seq1.p1  ORF type:complete len:267 (+),score=39.72 gnl/MRDRNA2_/MRDRNA2_113426_c0_seq1:39-839(+)